VRWAGRGPSGRPLPGPCQRGLGGGQKGVRWCRPVSETAQPPHARWPKGKQAFIPVLRKMGSARGVKPPRRSWQQHLKPLLGPIRIVPREVLFFSWGGYLPKTVAPMEPPACLRTWVLAAKSRAVSALLGALSGSTETPGAGLAQRPLEKGRCAEHRAGGSVPQPCLAPAPFFSPGGLPLGCPSPHPYP